MATSPLSLLGDAVNGVENYFWKAKPTAQNITGTNSIIPLKTQSPLPVQPVSDQQSPSVQSPVPNSQAPYHTIAPSQFDNTLNAAKNFASGQHNQDSQTQYFPRPDAPPQNKSWLENVVSGVKHLLPTSTEVTSGHVDHPNQPMTTMAHATQSSPPPAPTQDPFSGFTTAPVPSQFASTIAKAASDNGIPAQVLASLLFTESGFNPSAQNANRDASGNVIANNIDRGIAQINSVAHPDITDQQAFDPDFSINYAASLLGHYIKNLGINRGIAAYNVGQGGANINGSTASGLGEKGHQYLQKVATGLSPELRNKLGIIYTGQ